MCMQASVIFVEHAERRTIRKNEDFKIKSLCVHVLGMVEVMVIISKFEMWSPQHGGYLNSKFGIIQIRHHSAIYV